MYVCVYEKKKLGEKMSERTREREIKKKEERRETEQFRASPDITN